MHSMILQRLAGVQTAVAAALGVSDSTVSRAKDSSLELVCQIAAQLGLKLVDAERICLSQAEVRFLRATYSHVSEQAPWLLNEGDE